MELCLRAHVKYLQLLLCLILQGVAGDALEGSIHIDVLLGGRLKVGDATL